MCRVRWRGIRERMAISSEVGGGGFVAPDLLRGDHPVEVGPEALACLREQVVVNVGDDAEAVARSKSPQRVRRVREGGPVTDGSREGAAFGRGGVEAERAAHLFERQGEDRPVGAVAVLLHDMLRGAEGRQDGRAAGWGPGRRDARAGVGFADPPHRRDDPRLPVHQGAVAVEGEQVEPRRVERDRLTPRASAGFAAGRLRVG